MADYMVTAPYGYSGGFKCTFDSRNYGTDPLVDEFLIDDSSKTAPCSSSGSPYITTLHLSLWHLGLHRPSIRWQGSVDYFNENAEPPNVNNAINVVEISSGASTSPSA